MLEIFSVCKQYTSGRGHITALTDISFSVAKGQSFTLAGKSGSGKTTLLNCLGALEQPDGGRILYNGQDICSMSSRQRAYFQRRDIGFVFQTANLLPWLTVAENLMLPLELNSIYGKKQKGRIEELLACFDLVGYEKAMPGEMSGGENQRIAFARAIAHKPALILADEPTSSLDSVTGYNLIELILSLCDVQGSTLVVATHDPELIELTNNRLYLKDGRIEAAT
ncbi:ABC transporter ATP-binding protein [Desulforhopalus sp. IMCC35007]|uniref:ABC transporter ATP-binding protein n=1 Tax=Desulforhopalus sp. IMCC35007 TaxID=2569543 RepID=UPI0010AE1852|nr:ABC transporter ATP-binding protein [Desulforhopalus sp. IMCC35007]TKB07483.1 ABC transporter ATP-binding protein [Desulforhopalus sp. IMCC35007]